MINTPPNGANAIVGFDIDKFIKGDLNDNKPQELSAPNQSNQGLQKDVVDLNTKSNKQPESGWKTFGKVFIAGVIALCSIPVIKKAYAAFKKSSVKF